MVELMEERTLEATTGAVHQRWVCPESQKGGHDTDPHHQQTPQP
ncbi:hypothetical protein [Streptomyces sp. NPDC006552]